MSGKSLIVKNKYGGEKSKSMDSSKNDASVAETRNKKRKNKNLSVSYKLYVFKVLKEVHRDIGISANAMEIMNSFVNDMFEKIAQEASKLVKLDKRSTLTARDIETAVRFVLNGELRKHAMNQGNKALQHFNKS